MARLARVAVAEVAYHVSPSFRHQIGPGGKQQTEVDVTKEHDLSQLGMYTVQVERADPENKGRRLKSNTVTITVTP